MTLNDLIKAANDTASLLTSGDVRLTVHNKDVVMDFNFVKSDDIPTIDITLDYVDSTR